MTQLIQAQALYLGAYNLTPRAHTLAESATVGTLEATTLGDDTERYEPGLKGYGFAGSAYWQGGDHNIDFALNDYQGTRNVPFTLALESPAAGARARIAQTMVGQASTAGSVGELLEVEFSLGTMGPALGGRILHAGSATGNVTGTAVQVGAVAAGQRLYAALHVMSGTGAFTVNVQSASVSGFGTPNTRLTFTTVATGTPRAYQWLELGTTITDTWWRVSATNPNTRDFAVTIAIF